MNSSGLGASYVAAILLALGTLGDFALAASIDVVLLDGDPSPDGNGMFAACIICDPVLNDRGEVGFSASIVSTAGSIGGYSGIFIGHPTKILPIVTEVHAPPDGNGRFTSFSSRHSLSSSGYVAFEARRADTLGGATDDRVLYRGDGQQLIEIVSEGQTAPDGNGRFADRGSPNPQPGFSSPIVNSRGNVAFSALLTDTSEGFADNRGLFLKNGLGLLQFARGGQSAPGTNRLFVAPDRFSLNNAGQVAFNMTLSFLPGDTSLNEGIFLSDGLTILNIANTDQLTPDGTANFANFVFGPDINESGEVAFTAFLDDIFGNKVGVYRTNGTTLVEIARTGQTVPDGNGRYFQMFDPAINGTGQVAFRASLTGTSGAGSDNVGYFRDDNGTVIQIVREGELVPDGNGTFDLRLAPAFNDAGQFAFVDLINNTTGGDLDDSGLFFFDDALGLIQIAREGQPFLGSNLVGLGFHGNRDSSGQLGEQFTGLNNRGQVAFEFQLADGRSGIAIWSIPEPSTMKLMLLVFIIACRQKPLNLPS